MKMTEFHKTHWEAYKKKIAYQTVISEHLGKYMIGKCSHKGAAEIKSMLSIGHGMWRRMI